MSERLKTRLTIVGLIVSICLGVGGPLATFQLMQFRLDAAEARDVKQETRMDRMDARDEAVAAELSLIRRMLERIDERTTEMQRNNRRNQAP